MGFGEAVRACLGSYATFAGRAPRSEYWWFVVFQALVNAAAAGFDHAVGSIVVGALADLLLFVPTLAVAVRRLHDIDRSGWWLLVGLIPVVGWIIVIIWACTRGSFGPNRFGLDPLPPPFAARA